ncbi:carbohydrate ABC transporter permease [Floridanema evergladense]|uniref:Carbohydrate ABC transporter permease n=1 Tax=Floridaenema evergladense BLCC-F167 TaxID=3153639 RepID=A0ABV4WFI7_9CYAN
MICTRVKWLIFLLVIITLTSCTFARGNNSEITLTLSGWQSNPNELEEAAAMDGLNRWETFLQIVLPLAKPALAAQAIFIFMGAWNNFLTPLLILSEKEMFTLPLGLNTFKGEYISYWNYIMAASMVLTLPALAIYAFFNRYFIQSVTFTGGK